VNSPLTAAGRTPGPPLRVLVPPGHHGVRLTRKEIRRLFSTA
jgi:hypothetical protein